MDDAFGLVLFVYVLAAAVALAALFFVVRAAILSALALDRRRVAEAEKRSSARVPTHLDADGL